MTRYKASENGRESEHLVGILHRGDCIELTRIKEKVKSLSTDLKIKKSLGGHQLALTERQIKIMEFIQNKDSCRIRRF